MSKRITITDQIQKRIQATYGGQVDTSAFVCFEAVALNTLPIRQAGSIYDSAIVSEATLTEMAAVLQRGEGVPIQLMHDTEDLPAGKAFWGEVVRNSYGQPSLVIQFWISASEPQVIAKVEDGTVGEVSVGFVPLHLTCSKCGFDFMSPTADPYMLWMQTCENGHVIGKDGVHVNVSGLKAWNETSLVGKGAASGAKILTPKNADGTLPLAADGRPARALCLQLIANKETPMAGENPTQQVTVNLAEFTGTAQKLADVTVNLATAQAQLTSVTAERDAAAAKITDLETRLAASAPKVDYDAALTALKDQHSKLSVALNQTAAAPDGVAELVTAIGEMQTKLASLITPGAKTGEAGGGSGDTPAAATFSPSVFKTKR
jgi:hypothetical protein